MKLLYIHNPQAGHGHADKMLPEIESAFTSRGVDFHLQRTDYPEHAISILKEADIAAYDGIIAAGGDGTLYEVLNGYMQNPAEKRPPLGVLPVGTGNAAVRDMNLDRDHWEKAVDIIVAGHTRKVDVGRFITHGQTYYFMNILGLGFVADVTKTAGHLKIFGNISYTLGVLYQTLRLSHLNLKIEIDGKQIERNNLFVEVSNTRYTSNFLMAPQAEIDDGYLDITLANQLSRRRLLKVFPKVFTGEHIHEPEVEIFKAKSIKIETDPVKVLAPDGELLGTTPLQIDCIHHAVDMFWTKQG
ncbi:diacylglycerol kinase family lipid kinase [bacterium]|nr:diacylglycerol kinase family lipid kinase [bacterium]